MTTQTRAAPRPAGPSLQLRHWAPLGATAAAISAAGVVIAQALALAAWPEVAAFRPLDSFPRSVLFTVVPAIIATVVLAQLARRTADPVRPFVGLAAGVLLLSFIPDFVLPDANRTLLASSVAAGLHVVAAVLTTGVLVAGYLHQTGQCAHLRARH